MHTPDKAKQTMKDLGSELRLARKRRLWTLADLSKKMSVSAPTLIALEKGELTVSVGVLVSALWILGLDSELRTLARPLDAEGIELMNSRLPKRIRMKKNLGNDL